MADTWTYRTELDPTVIPDEWVWERLRARRDTLLRDSDWTMHTDAPVDVAAWQTYRQALRDLTTAPDPRAVTWPTMPATVGTNANLATLKAQALAAFNTNRAAIAAANPTTAQVIAQVKNLSAQNNAIMRIVLGLLDGTN
jgi:hypothetical protein